MPELGNSLQENNDQEKWQKENLEMNDSVVSARHYGNQTAPVLLSRDLAV